eukprot:10185836-Karenia_brevis.AAC.1
MPTADDDDIFDNTDGACEIGVNIANTLGFFDTSVKLKGGCGCMYGIPIFRAVLPLDEKAVLAKGTLT